MDFSKFAGMTGAAADPGAYIKAELEEGLGPILQRVDKLEKKLDTLILTAGRIETLLKSIQPVVELIKKIPFIK